MNEVGSYSKSQLFKFLFASIIGILLFLIPIRFQGQQMLLVGIIVNTIQSTLSTQLPTIMTFLIVVPTFISLINTLHPLPFIENTPVLKPVFTSTRFWLIVKVIGSVFAVMSLFKFGPALIIGPRTGGNIMSSLLPTCGMWFFISGLLLPLLTDYGVMDLAGTLMKNWARPLFKIPGRALIDCFSSWIGSGVCGAMLTINQHDNGYYTGKEAAIIITNFSVVGISFCSAIAQYLNIYSVFGYFYLTIVICGLVCAVITPRIWPLNKVPSTYLTEEPAITSEEAPDNVSNFRWGIDLAVKRAADAPSLLGFFSKGLLMAFDIIANTAPILMAFGTISLILAEYTPIFTVLSYPFQLLLNFLNVPFAKEAAPAMIIGFADQYLPVIIGAPIPHIETRFIIGCMSVLQVIYITEIGALILTSKIPLNFKDLIVIFFERTLICLPVILLAIRIFL